jgi:Tol biopolymer transport system component
LKLVDLAISPDHQSLAILTKDDPIHKGHVSGWLSSINLLTHDVQALPDYSHYDLFEYSVYQPPQRILGWTDTNQVLVQQEIDAGVAAASKDGTSYSKLPFPPQYTFAVESALSPAGSTPGSMTLFSVLTGQTGGYWLYNTDGSNPGQIVDAENMKTAYYPLWSPDSNYISFLSPRVDQNGLNDNYIGLWVLDVDRGEQIALSSNDVWDVSPAWSPDTSSENSTIAFLRADEPITDADVWHTRPEKLATNIFAINVSGSNLRAVTSFNGAKNSSLRWTSGGNFILSSTASSSSPNDLPSILSVLGTAGTVTTLVNAGAGESLVRPLVWASP